MTNESRITRVARDVASFDERIAANVGFQEIDLNEWIFSRFSVPKGFNVLELCCGVGMQTAYLAGGTGRLGVVHAVDISSDAIERLSANVGGDQAGIIVPIEANIDEFPKHLKERGLKPPHFDVIFCAYGLYYCSDIGKTLSDIKKWLKPGGVFVVVGPFGLNNYPLYEILGSVGAKVPEVVCHASSRFMLNDVVPWAAERFERVEIHTMVNRITWEDQEKLLAYWKNSTFYDESKLEAVVDIVSRHFTEHGKFVNEKWVMLLIASGKRVAA